MKEFSYLDHLCQRVSCSSYEDKSACGLCSVMDAVYNRAKFPNVLRDRKALDISGKSKNDLEAYRTLKDLEFNIISFVKEGRSLYIYSENKGNGKTSWAIRLIQAFVKDYSRIMISCNKYPLENCLFRFVNTATMFEEFRKSFNNKEYDEDLEKDILQSKLVVWDDIGVEAPTKWVREKFYILINDRELNKRSNIFTSNLSKEGLLKNFIIDDRVYSRIGPSMEIRFVGPDRREHFDRTAGNKQDT